MASCSWPVPVFGSVPLPSLFYQDVLYGRKITSCITTTATKVLERMLGWSGLFHHWQCLLIVVWSWQSICFDLTPWVGLMGSLSIVSFLMVPDLDNLDFIVAVR